MASGTGRPALPVLMNPDCVTPDLRPIDGGVPDMFPQSICFRAATHEQILHDVTPQTPILIQERDAQRTLTTSTIGQVLRDGVRAYLGR